MLAAGQYEKKDKGAFRSVVCGRAVHSLDTDRINNDLHAVRHKTAFYNHVLIGFDKICLQQHCISKLSKGLLLRTNEFRSSEICITGDISDVTKRGRKR